MMLQFARPLVLVVALVSAAQAAETKYQTPPAPIAAMIDATPTPRVIVSGDRKILGILGRENLPTVAALGQPILRLAGHRINPRTNGQAEIRMNWLTEMSFQDMQSGTVKRVALPAKMRFADPAWSPNNQHLAFVAEAANGLELWVADVATAQARRVTGAVLNATFDAPFIWLRDSSGFIVASVKADRKAPPQRSTAPDGPTVQENLGRVAPNPTYEDLLENAHDEALFDYYFTSQLARVDIKGGALQPIGKAGLIAAYSLSPDGKHLLVTQNKRPFSYVVPSNFFPTEIAVWSATGTVEHRVVDRPLIDNLSTARDSVAPGPRNVSWRNDAPATLVWAEAQDGGDPARDVPMHDRVLLQDAPFKDAPRTLTDVKERYVTTVWGRDDVAMVMTRWFKTRHETRLLVDPSKPGTSRIWFERNAQDQYKDPGTPVLKQNAAGRPVMQFASDGNSVLTAGLGAARDGDHPFLAQMALDTGAVNKIWTANEESVHEIVAGVLDDAGTLLLTQRQSATQPPNYFVRKTGATDAPRQLTQFADPMPQFAGVQKQTVAYKRADGVALSGTLYLPPGYDPKRDGPLPTLLWAYPTEFTDAAVAGQVVDRAKNRFTRPQGISHLFLVTQGYAVLDGPSMPIIGVNGAEPNDTYIEQLRDDAKAAVDTVVAMGVADRDRIAVGGHSYGAFMTANLLAHTDLFRAGIARSGAYNRTLTPFGFQAEQRTYWQATDTYQKMSPFTYVQKIKAPVLLIHGGADDNSGTFPIQSERFYAALKGNGATVRYVVLPNEPHGYRGRESTLHTLWEMNGWMERYVKNAPPRARADAGANEPAPTAR
ncbi:S9 family peptidase [Roseiterribacter gracilis]|uniref:Peptidase S9 prolyl oligopeptidase catalytic domain-containing protein n=1 Tax=Roseiterribacter gracilis TaxID=2812848 RepID=A0A8S8XHA4_9PROT|nr:hypothetical protein TMPK1_31440 [Rhodospirillales bacterium TMPK1]